MRSQTEPEPARSASSILSPRAWQKVTLYLGLSKREGQILRGVFDSTANKALASGLGLSEHTIHTHIARMFNYYYGCRPYPYTTDTNKNPYTFADIATNTARSHPGIPCNPSPHCTNDLGNYHNVLGTLWGTTLWEARANVLTQFGWNYQDVFLETIIEGMKLTPRQPNFLQARNGVLLADLVNNSSAYTYDFWKAFAKRGMGWSAGEKAAAGSFAPDYVAEAYDGPPGYCAWTLQTAGGIYSSPAVGSDGTIYFATIAPDNKVYALNTNGTVEWSYTGGASFYSSPAIGSDGTIYVGCYDGYLYALTNGSVKWRYLASGNIFSSPALGTNGVVYFGTMNHYVYALDSSGNVKWIDTVGNTIYSSPSIGLDGSVYIGCMDSNVYAFNASSGITNSGWPFHAGNSVYASPSIGSDGEIYVGTMGGRFYSISTSGATNWQYSTGGAIESSAAIAPDGTIYVGSQDYKLYALTSGGSNKWTYSTGYQANSSPAIGNEGGIFFGSDDGHVYGLTANGTMFVTNHVDTNGIAPMNEVWPYPAGGSVFSSPTIAPIGTNGMVYVGSSNGKLYALYGETNSASTVWPCFRFNNKHTGNPKSSW